MLNNSTNRIIGKSSVAGDRYIKFGSSLYQDNSWFDERYFINNNGIITCQKAGTYRITYNIAEWQADMDSINVFIDRTDKSQYFQQGQGIVNNSTFFSFNIEDELEIYAQIYKNTPIVLKGYLVIAQVEE